MIIGENFNNDYDGYAEENYDYLFKRKGGGPTPRQQRKIEKRAAAGKPISRHMQKRLDKKAGIAPKKRLIMGNFGMFNKNKKIEEAAAAANDASVPEVDNTSDALPADDMNQAPEVNSNTSEPAVNADAGAENPAPANTPEDSPAESQYDEFDEPAGTPKPETKETKKEKKSGWGVAFGFTCLGIALTLAGIAIVRGGKSEHAHAKVAA